MFLGEGIIERAAQISGQATFKGATLSAVSPGPQVQTLVGTMFLFVFFGRIGWRISSYVRGFL